MVDLLVKRIFSRAEEDLEQMLALIRVDNGKIAEQWGVLNFSLFIQLGLMESPSQM